jgi:septum site-determining protein MinD
MSKIVAVHSYKGGTGKTIMAVNLAATFVKQGKKVAIFDLDFKAPSLFAILRCEKAKAWLNDYLNKACKIDDVLVDLSSRIPDKGKLYAGLANPAVSAMRNDSKWELQALDYLLSLKNKLIDEQNFDYIIFDTSPGLQFSSMNALVAADLVVVTTTGDCSDVNGTKRMISEFYPMFNAKTGIIINKVLDEEAKSNNTQYVKKIAKKIQEDYNVPLLGVVPCFCEVLRAEGKYLFPQDKPNHLFTTLLSEMAAKIETNDIN